jgi:hypothetical protein
MKNERNPDDICITVGELRKTLEGKPDSGKVFIERIDLDNKGEVEFEFVSKEGFLSDLMAEFNRDLENGIMNKEKYPNIDPLLQEPFTEKDIEDSRRKYYRALRADTYEDKENVYINAKYWKGDL